jgi:hypothetical protein
VRPSRDEIIEARMLVSLALIAEANDRSLVEELNLAVQAYVRDQLPLSSDSSAGAAIGVAQAEDRDHAA